MFNRYFIVGFGRLGKAISQQLVTQNLPLFGIYNRSKTNYSLKANIAYYSDLSVLKSKLLPGDCVFITVPDQFILEFAGTFDLEGITLLHCSGATEIFQANLATSGVFYPLMTFTNDTEEVNWKSIPVFLESNDAVTLENIKVLANDFGLKDVFNINSADRLKVHVAAVLANNMIQALFAASSNYLENNNLPSTVLLPIVNQMVSKWGSSDPVKSLTGPMVRGDFNTIQKHELLLQNHPELLAVYQSMNQLIAKMLQENSKN